MAVLIQLNDGVAVKKFSIDKPSLRIGRGSDNDIFIDDKVVSKRHAIIEVEEDPDQKGIKAYYITDLEHKIAFCLGTGLIAFAWIPCANHGRE